MANPYIKKANTTEEFEPWHLEELARCSVDYKYFIRTYVKIQHPIKGTIPFDLFDYQEEMLDLIHNNKDSLVLMARQCGKTQTVSSGYILWLANFSEDKNCVIASKNMSHATEIMSRIKFSYEELPNWLKAGCLFYNRTSIEFDNGSKIKSEATTEKTGRGGSPSLIFIDEIAFASRRIQDELWASLAPSLSTGGKLILTTTPNGDTDLFARLWRESVSGLNSFANILVTYDKHPERGPESGYYQDMLEKIGELRCRVELMCEFLSSDALLVSSQRLIEFKPTTPIMEDNGYQIWDEIHPTSMYLVGVDVGTGSGKDFSVIEVFEFPSLNQVAEYRTNSLNIPALYNSIKWLLEKLTQMRDKKRPEVFWTFERNGVGEALSALYHTDDTPPEFAELVNDTPGKYGMVTTGRNKILSCLQLKSLLEKVKNGMKLNSAINIFELKNFVASGGSYAAKSGATDDSISSLLLIVRLLKHIADFEDGARKALYEYNENDYIQGALNDSADDSDEPIPFLII